MRSSTRHRLKQDAFVESTREAMLWSGEHRKPVILALVLAVLAVMAAIGYGSYTSSQDAKAGIQLGAAMRAYNSPLRAPGAAVQPGDTSFATSGERSAAALAKFLKTANDFPRTRNGKFARYMAGVTAMEKGDNTQSEQLLQETAGDGKDVSALSKFALASLYRTTGKSDQAAAMYREVIQADTLVAPPVTARLELASLYEEKQPGEAIKVYEEIIKQEQEARKATAGQTVVKPGAEAARSPIEQVAVKKIEELKAKAAGK